MILPRPDQKAPLQFKYGLLLLVCYCGAAKLGLSLATINHHVSPIWPASGVALSGLLILGRKYWSFIWAGAFLSNLFLGTPIWTVLIMSVGNTLEAVISEFWFRRLDKGRSPTELSMIASLAASAVFSVPVAALIGSLALSMSHWGSPATFQMGSNLFTWWTGDTIGLLLVVPVVLRARIRSYSSKTWRQGLEFLAYCLVVAAVGHLTLWARPYNAASIMFLYPVLLLGIYRFGAVETGVSLWVLVGMCIWAAFQDQGPFNGGDFNSNLIQLQLFVATLSATELALRSFRRTKESKSTVVVLSIGWIITGLIFHSFNRKESEIDQARFHKLVSDANAKLSERLIMHETVLRAGAGFLRSRKKFDDDKWRAFVAELELQKFSGLYGIGHIISVPNDELESWLKQREKKYGPEMKFTVFDSPGMRRTPMPFDSHFIVIAFEPRRRGNKPLAIDITYDAERYQALKDARDTGKIIVSDQVPIQNMVDTSGYVAVAPVYLPDRQLNTVEDRRASFMGWVHSPILMSRLLEGIFGNEAPEVAMEAEMVGSQQGEGTLYPASFDEHDLNLRYEIHTELPLWGKKLRMTWYRTNLFQSRKDTTAAWIHFIGVVFTLLITALMLVFENQFVQAQRIADQKTREVELRERLWTSLTRVVPAGIFQLDLKGKLTFTNEKWVEYTKLDISQRPDADWISAVDAGDRETVQMLWEDLRSNVTDLMQVQCRIPASSKTFALSLRAVPDEHGSMSYFIGTLHDITEIHSRQMQIMHSSRMASVGVMAAGMAHEINNPLTIIAGRTQLMMRHLDQPELPRDALRDSTTIIKQTVDRIARIVRGLRAFSRGGETDSFLVASVLEIVQSTTEFCAERFKKGGVELRVKAVPAIELGCREVQISQVLLNLINNGFDAAMALDEKWVEIEVIETPTEVKFCVTDSGKGIPSEVAEKIMIPFFTTKPVGQGTGLGLSISKGIAQDHSGDLVLDTQSQHTRFVFTVSKRLLEDGTVLAAL